MTRAVRTKPSFATEDEFREILRFYITPAEPISNPALLRGREAKLKEIDRQFNNKGAHIFIHGDRGVGKTSLALSAAVEKHPDTSEPPDAGNQRAAMANVSPHAVLTRDKGAAALSDLGYPVTKATLATLASRGGGPFYRRFGKRVVYRWSDLLAWAETRCGAAIGNSREMDASDRAVPINDADPMAA